MLMLMLVTLLRIEGNKGARPTDVERDESLIKF